MFSLTRNDKVRTRYSVVDGRLCIEHFLLLQQLTYRKKLKDDKFKEYFSYHVKLPRVIFDLLDPVDNMVYLEGCDGFVVVHRMMGDGFKRIRIQESRKGDGSVIYQLTVPQKLLSVDAFVRGETFVRCRVVSCDDGDGFRLTLSLV